MVEKDRIPIAGGLWGGSLCSSSLRLLGSRCNSCKELFFPKKLNGVCTHCQSNDLEDVELSDHGRISTCTIIYQPPAGGAYKGPVPYAYGVVELPEGIKVLTLLTSSDLESLVVGLEVALVVEPLFENDAGQDVITFKFRPVEEIKEQ
jgi:uncharacterized OB-fold protein